MSWPFFLVDGVTELGRQKKKGRKESMSRNVTEKKKMLLLFPEISTRTETKQNLLSNALSSSPDVLMRKPLWKREEWTLAGHLLCVRNKRFLYSLTLTHTHLPNHSAGWVVAPSLGRALLQGMYLPTSPWLTAGPEPTSHVLCQAPYSNGELRISKGKLFSGPRASSHPSQHTNSKPKT